LKAVYAGSFDPVTYGHMDIIERSAAIFDELTVAIANNPNKSSTFTVEERIGFLEDVTKHLKNVTIDTFSCLLVEYLQRKNCLTAIRGLRAMSDFEMEFQMALVNKNLYPKMETVFLVTSAKYSFVRSSGIKEVATFGGSVRDFVPPIVEEGLRRKLGR
jgi:pantetheine-phosphate adenylyltransferase